MADESYHIGWDYFTPDPGEWESYRCRACGTELLVERDVTGKRSMFGSSDAKFDRFHCRHSQEEWHTHVIKLHEAIEAMPSVSVADMMRIDLEDILREKVANASRAHAMKGANEPYEPSMFG